MLGSLIAALATIALAPAPAPQPAPGPPQVPLIGRRTGENRPVTLLDPDTLRPLPGSPRLPSARGRFAVYEISPDGRKIVAETSSRRHTILTFISVRTGRRLARLPVRGGAGVLSWRKPNRLLAIGGGRNARVRTVDTHRYAFVHKVDLDLRLTDSAPLGDRQIVLTNTRRGGPQRLRILGPDGEVQHVVDLPGLTEGGLHDASPTGDALVLDGTGTFVYAVDPDTGKAVRHDLDVHASYWFEPQVPGMLAAIETLDGPDALHILDPRTFKVVKTVTGEVPPSALGAGFAFEPFDARTGGDVIAYTADGTERYRISRPPQLIAAFGPRLYGFFGISALDRHDGEPRIGVYDPDTGRRLRVVRGRYELQEPSLGRTAPPGISTKEDNAFGP